MSIHAYFIEPAGRSVDELFDHICTLPITWEHETRLVQHIGDGYFEISGTIAGMTEVPFREPPLLDVPTTASL